MLLGFILYAVTQWIPGDWFHYQEWISRRSFSLEDQEAPYLFLRLFLNHNYLLFRIIVWGAAAILLSRVFKTMYLDIKSSLAVFFSMYAMIFSYGRVSLGMAVFFLGYSLLIHSKESNYKPIQFIGGIILMLLSTSFHRSMIVLVLLSAITLIPINKRTIYFYILLAIGVFYLGRSYLNDFISSGFIEGDLTWKLERAETEIDRTTGRNFNGALLSTLKFATVYIPVLCISFALFRKDVRKQVPVHIIEFYILSLFIIAYALAMYVAFANDVFYYRTLYMCMIPNCVVLSYLYQNHLLKKIEWGLSFYIGVLYNGLSLFLFSI
ncbi:MAG: EpsG family protein [Bacteroidales bacterium]|nr:EpsG family protein [Bacteroidales bacterium]